MSTTTAIGSSPNAITTTRIAPTAARALTRALRTLRSSREVATTTTSAEHSSAKTIARVASPLGATITNTSSVTTSTNTTPYRNLASLRTCADSPPLIALRVEQAEPASL